MDCLLVSLSLTDLLTHSLMHAYRWLTRLLMSAYELLTGSYQVND